MYQIFVLLHLCEAHLNELHIKLWKRQLLPRLPLACFCSQKCVAASVWQMSGTLSAWPARTHPKFHWQSEYSDSLNERRCQKCWQADHRAAGTQRDGEKQREGDWCVSKTSLLSACFWSCCCCFASDESSSASSSETMCSDYMFPVRKTLLSTNCWLSSASPANPSSCPHEAQTVLRDMCRVVTGQLTNGNTDRDDTPAPEYSLWSYTRKTKAEMMLAEFRWDIVEIGIRVPHFFLLFLSILESIYANLTQVQNPLTLNLLRCGCTFSTPKGQHKVVFCSSAETLQHVITLYAFNLKVPVQQQQNSLRNDKKCNYNTQKIIIIVDIPELGFINHIENSLIIRPKYWYLAPNLQISLKGGGSKWP